MAEENEVLTPEPITVALYEVMEKVAVDETIRKFYQRIGTAEIMDTKKNVTVMAVKQQVEGEDVVSTFHYDADFSRQAGHRGYIRYKGNARPLTPLS